MSQLGVFDWFGLISFMIAVLSLLFNYIQWRRQKALEKDIALRTLAGMNSGYQALWRIAELCDRVREVRNKAQSQEECLAQTYETIHEITGCVDTGRSVMNSICRDLVGSRLHYESPWQAQKLVNDSKQ